jgi:hypothetical protein
MRLLTATVVVVGLTSSAFADDVSDMFVARELGQIVRTADICGYKLDATKVAKFMEERIAKMGETARAWFQSSGGAQEIRLEKMNEIERTATCALQAQLAHKYGLAP